MPTVTVRRLAPAKLNLFLEITGTRDDGYHLIDSLIGFLDIGDAVALGRAPETALTVSGPFAAGVPQGEDNLALRALRLVEEMAGRSLPLDIALDKQIPTGAGLGGGSSDAAAVLKGVRTIYNLDITVEELQRAALALGADLPACLHGAPVRAGGVGEVLEPVMDCPSYDVVVAYPAAGLATADVYGRYSRAHTDCACCGTSTHFKPLSYTDALAVRRNDLERAAIDLVPAVGQALEQLAHSPGCQLARMSGSGSACFGLFSSAEAAGEAARAIHEAQPAWWVRAARLYGSGGRRA